MFDMSLVLSLILLFLVCRFACKSEHPLANILSVSTAVGLFSLGVCMIALPVVFFQAVALDILGLVWALRHWQPRTYVLLSSAATFAVYAVFGVIAFRDTKRLQEEFAYVSLNDRLPSPTPLHPVAPLPPAMGDRLTQLEDRLENEGYRWLRQRRADILRAIHEDTVRVFVDQPGFGVARMGGMKSWLLRRVHQGQPISQPGTPNPSPWVSLTNQSQSKATDDLRSLHEDSVLDFANPANFGFIKDRQHVAGFHEHQISEMPAPPMQWAFQRLDLIGLVLHKEPVAYVSEHLPRMDELRAAPTRSLDDFESSGLSALRSGEDLFVCERESECRMLGAIRAARSECRMLGAIRAARQCLACHEGERGDLLGAFSYTLTSERKESRR